MIAEAKDTNAEPRTIKSYRDDKVFPITHLEMMANGTIAAVLGEPVLVTHLSQHARTYHTAAGEGPFPVDDSQRSGLSSISSYKEKLPSIRAWLIEVSRRRGAVTYAEVMDRFGLTYYPLLHTMSQLGKACQQAGEPILPALIVDKTTGHCSQGLFGEFHIDDDEQERQRCYDRWSAHETGKGPPAAENATDFKRREARFAMVEIRPMQAAFRQAVFAACKGRCVISGCAVPEALEAAHLVGKDWRRGHNRSSDGLLLRRDLHALYDSGLLRITAVGRIELDDRLLAEYGDLADSHVC